VLAEPAVESRPVHLGGGRRVCDRLPDEQRRDCLLLGESQLVGIMCSISWHYVASLQLDEGLRDEQSSRWLSGLLSQPDRHHGAPPHMAPHSHQAGSFKILESEIAWLPANYLRAR